jgi:GNAT superfamily N-acetyltransferase
MLIRPIARDDYKAWRPLWDGYNSFYGRAGETALPELITATTWDRFFNPVEPIFALVAEKEGALVGLAHYLFHHSSTRIEPVCYMQDLFTEPTVRRSGVARALIQAVYQQATQANAKRVYWMTQTANEAGRRLYDQMAAHHGFIVYSTELTLQA